MKNQLIGWLSRNPNSKLPAICIGLRQSVLVIAPLLDELIQAGIVKGHGYASHTEEYYVTQPMTEQEIGQYVTMRK